MFVDACALIAVIMREETADAYGDALTATEHAFTSPLAAWEAAIVLARPEKLDCSYPKAADIVLDWLDAWGIAVRESANPEHLVRLAADVADKHGLGKRALSNFDCFHYAHAKVAGAPMLTLDRLLRATDVGTVPGEV